MRLIVAVSRVVRIETIANSIDMVAKRMMIMTVKGKDNFLHWLSSMMYW